MSEITTIGLDLAKNVFHVVGCDARGKDGEEQDAQAAGGACLFGRPAACLMGMEACASAHYWARELAALGHEVKLIPPQHVKAFVRGNKNDYNDALAIAEAVSRPEMRFVAVKTAAQQDIQALHRLRERRWQRANRTVQSASRAAGGIRPGAAQGVTYCVARYRSCSKMARTA